MERFAGSRSDAQGDSLCQVCGAALDGGGAVVRCPSCDTLHHADCWSFNQGCSTYGCAQARSGSALPAGVRAESAVTPAAVTPAEPAADAPVLVIGADADADFAEVDAGTRGRWLVLERGLPDGLWSVAELLAWGMGFLGFTVFLDLVDLGDPRLQWAVGGLLILAWLLPLLVRSAGVTSSTTGEWWRWRFDLDGRRAFFERASPSGWKLKRTLPLADLSTVALVRAALPGRKRCAGASWWLEARTPREAFPVSAAMETYGDLWPPDHLLDALEQLAAAGVAVDTRQLPSRPAGEGPAGRSRHSRRSRRRRRGR